MQRVISWIAKSDFIMIVIKLLPNNALINCYETTALDK